MSFQAKDLPTFKDNDFLTAGARINIGQEAKDKLIAKLEKDVDVSATMVTESECY